MTIQATTNQLIMFNGAGPAYDNQGNQTFDGYANRYFNAENRMTKAGDGAQAQYYYYNAEGQRVRRVVNGEEWWMIYGFDGELLAEYKVNGTFNGSNAPAQTAPVKEYIYRDGQLLVVSEPTNADGRKLQ